MKPAAPYGDALFPYVRAAYDAHADNCESLQWFWFGHHGGVAALSDLSTCDDCDVMFWNEGLALVDDHNGFDGDELWLCGCCARRRHHRIKVRPEFGISVEDTPELGPDTARRVWWWRAEQLTSRWWPLAWRGGDEYGNSTIAVRIPGGTVLVALNLPLRREMLPNVEDVEIPSWWSWLPWLPWR